LTPTATYPRVASRGLNRTRLICHLLRHLKSNEELPPNGLQSAPGSRKIVRRRPVNDATDGKERRQLKVGSATRPKCERNSSRARRSRTRTSGRGSRVDIPEGQNERNWSAFERMFSGSRASFVRMQPPPLRPCFSASFSSRHYATLLCDDHLLQDAVHGALTLDAQKFLPVLERCTEKSIEVFWKTVEPRTNKCVRYRSRWLP
jgi:hypothetical protein